MTNVGACQRMAEAFWGLAGASGGASWGSLELLGGLTGASVGAHWGRWDLGGACVCRKRTRCTKIKKFHYGRF